jgi:hypothetical protein
MKYKNEELIAKWKARLDRFKRNPEIAKGMDPATAMGVQHGRVKALEICLKELEDEK